MAAYVPNSGDQLSRLDYRVNSWDADFHAYMRKLESEKGKPIILAADMNCAHEEKDIFDPDKFIGYPGFTT